MKIIFRCLLALALPLLLSGEETVSPAPPLTLLDCIHRALDRSFTMEIQRFGPALAQDNLRAARSRYAPVFSVAANQNVSLNGGTRNEGLGSSVSVAQPLNTGGSLTIGTNLSRAEVKPVFFVPGASYGSGVNFSFSQPLLQGAGFALNAIPTRQAEVGADTAQRTYRAGAMDVIQATENAYYALVGTREQRAVTVTSLGLAQRTLAEAQHREKNGLGTKLDVLQGELGVAQSQQALVQATNAVKAAEDGLLAIIGRFEFDTQLGPVGLSATEEAVRTPSIEDSFRLAKENQPEYVSARAALELADLDVFAAKNGLKPALSLNLNYNTSGSGFSSSGAISNSIDRDTSSWAVGLGLSYPWGRTSEKVRYRAAEAGLRQQKLALEQMEQTILQQVRTAVRDVDSNLESVRITTLAVEISSQKYNLETRRYSSGLSTSKLVLESQRDLAGSQVVLLQAKYNLQISMAALRRIEGATLDYYAITLPEPAELAAVGWKNDPAH